MENLVSNLKKSKKTKRKLSINFDEKLNYSVLNILIGFY